MDLVLLLMHVFFLRLLSFVVQGLGSALGHFVQVLNFEFLPVLWVVD